MNQKVRGDKTRPSYFGNVKSRLGSKLPAGVRQPPAFVVGPWDPLPSGSGAQDKLEKDAKDPSIGRTTHRVPYIRNPRLREYYLQEAVLQPDVTASKPGVTVGESDRRNREEVHPKDTVFSVTSQFNTEQMDGATLGKAPFTSLTPLQGLCIPESEASACRPSLKTMDAEPSSSSSSSSSSKPNSDRDINLVPAVPTTPLSPFTDAEYDKLLDVETMSMPDGQLCYLALPPECVPGEGPDTMQYLRLFCRYITDQKGVVSGILIVTSSKIFFDPCKSHPLVKENGCEEYLLSCSVDSLVSVAFFSDISHVHFSKSTQRWRGRKKGQKKSPHTVKSGTSPNPREQEAVPALVSVATPNLRLGLGLGTVARCHEEETGESHDMAEAERQMDGSPLEELVMQTTGTLGVTVLSSAATFCCGGQDAEIKMKTELDVLAPTEHQPSLPPSEPTSSHSRPQMFVRMRQRQKQRKRHGLGALELGKSKTLPSRDTWFILEQERSDELYAYLSQNRPDLCLLEGGEEEEREGEEEDFVLLDDGERLPGGEEEEDSSPGYGHTSDDWEMVSVEDGGGKVLPFADREPDGLHEILEQSLILDASQIRELFGELPPRTVGHMWRLAYSTSRHGASLKSLYRKLSNSDSPVLLIIKDSNHQVFGSFLSHPLRPSETFYGTGETFLFLLHPRFKCFRWTGENSFFIKGDVDSFAIGGGSGHFGLWLDEWLYLGRSSPCFTFNNCSLSETDDFRVLELEAWTFW